VKGWIPPFVPLVDMDMLTAHGLSPRRHQGHNRDPAGERHPIDGDDDNEDVFSDRTPFRQILKKLCSDYVVANIDRENALWMLERVRMVIPFALC